MKILDRGITYGHMDWVAVLPKKNSLHQEMLDHFNGDDPTIPWEPSGVPIFHLIPERIVPEEHGLPPAEESTFIANPKADFSKAFKEVIHWHLPFEYPEPLLDSPKMEGMYRIISVGMQELLSEFNLPPHQFIPVDLKLLKTGEVRRYFILRVLLEGSAGLKSTYWPATPITVRDVMSEEVYSEYPAGAFSSWQEMREKALFTLHEEGKEFALGEAPYTVLLEDLDLFRSGWTLAISRELQQAITEKFSDYWVGLSDIRIYSAFDPEKDKLPS